MARYRLALGIRYCRTAQRGVKDRMAALAGQPWRREPGGRPVRSATGAAREPAPEPNELTERQTTDLCLGIDSSCPALLHLFSERQALFHRGS